MVVGTRNTFYVYVLSMFYIYSNESWFDNCFFSSKYNKNEDCKCKKAVKDHNKLSPWDIIKFLFVLNVISCSLNKEDFSPVNIDPFSNIKFFTA